MWNLTNLEIYNLASIRKASIDFNDFTNASLIQGINLVNTGQKSNGSGKSIFLEAISLALIDTILRKVSISDLINVDYDDETNITLELDNSLTGDNLIITRKYSLKKGQTVEVSLNTEDIKRSSTSEYNKYILEQLDISKSDLINYYLIHKNTFKDFFLLGDKPKKELINRFSGASVLEGIDKAPKAKIKTLELENIELDNIKNKKIGRIEALTETKDKQLILYKQSVEDKDKQLKNKAKEKELTNESLTKYQSTIDTLDAKIELLEKSTVECEEKTTDFQLEKRKYELEIENVELKKVQIAADKLLAETAKSKFETEKNVIKIKINNKKVLLESSINCPKCAHEFVLSKPDLDLEVVRAEIANLTIDFDAKVVAISEKQDEIVEFNKLKGLVDHDIEEIQKKVKQVNISLNELTTKINQNKQSVRLSKDEISNLDKRLKLAKSRLLEIDQEIVNINNLEIKEVDASEFEADIKKERTEVEGLDLLISTNNQSIFDKKAWITIFEQFKTYLANKSITAINSYTNYFLKEINTDLQVEISGQKILKSGEVRDEIDTNIYRDGELFGLFHALSSGEQMRITLANILALQELINLNCKTGGLNLLFLDEVLNSLDELGIEKMIKSMANLKQNIFAITLKNLSLNIDNDKVITAIKTIDKGTIYHKGNLNKEDAINLYAA